jgi:hypothetical protein
MPSPTATSPTAHATTRTAAFSLQTIDARTPLPTPTNRPMLICRIECVAWTHTYAPAGMLTRRPVVRPEFHRYCREALLLLLEQACTADYERVTTEPFSSSDFAGLKDVDRFGQLPARQGKQRSLRKIRQDLSWAWRVRPARAAGRERSWRSSGKQACSARWTGRAHGRRHRCSPYPPARPVPRRPTRARCRRFRARRTRRLTAATVGPWVNDTPATYARRASCRRGKDQTR